MFERREGEVALAEDPGDMAPDAHLVFIGRIRSPWMTRAECPKNMAAARVAGRRAVVEIELPYRPGLTGMAGISHVVLLSWLGLSPRNLILQKPRHAAEPKGVFALRSPARPNPVGLHVAGLVALDVDAGLLTLDAIDVLDGTPVVDLKPYFASIDSFPGAMPPRHRDAP